MRWTEAEYEQYIQREAEAYQRRCRAHLEARANSAGGAPLCSDNSQPTQGDALVGVAPRKSKSRKGAVLGAARRHITYRVFAQRPADFDGYDIKEIQDCLVQSGLLDGDDWNLLCGTVLSEKAYSKEDERTEIELT